MKRSEMLEIIMDILDDSPYSWTLARRVLDRIEKEGMLPPKHQFEKVLFDGQDVQLYRSRDDVHKKIGSPGKVISYDTRNEWESE